MKTIQFSVTVLGEVVVPDHYSEEQIREAIVDIYANNEPNDIEWEEIQDD